MCLHDVFVFHGFGDLRHQQFVPASGGDAAERQPDTQCEYHHGQDEVCQGGPSVGLRILAFVFCLELLFLQVVACGILVGSALEQLGVKSVVQCTEALPVAVGGAVVASCGGGPCATLEDDGVLGGQRLVAKLFLQTVEDGEHTVVVA